MCALPQEKYAAKGTEIAELQFSNVSEQLETFRKHLEQFASRHKNDIKKDPEFRGHFQQMCARIGVDPLASSKGFWAQALGVGDFYYELGVQIIEICLATRDRNGGLMSFDELRKRVLATSGKTRQDVRMILLGAIKKLHLLGSGFAVITAGSHRLVQSVPGELSMDHSTVFQKAEATSYTSLEILMKDLGWTEQRARATLVNCQGPVAKRLHPS
eukprot:Em0004g11a